MKVIANPPDDGTTTLGELHPGDTFRVSHGGPIYLLTRAVRTSNRLGIVALHNGDVVFWGAGIRVSPVIGVFTEESK